MKLSIEPLEPRDVPAVNWYVGVIQPSPDGDPGSTVLFLQSDTATHHQQVIDFPQGRPWHGVPVNRMVVIV